MNLKNIKYLFVAVLAALGFASCSETDNTWDPYHSWQARNAEWFRLVADTARTAIAQAKATYGDAWEDHCDWRMYKTLMKSQDANSGKLCDSICVKVIQRGNGTVTPNFSDTVRLSYRGWLMETQYDNGDGKLLSESHIFTQTYFGAFNPETAAPIVSPVSSMTEGFQTALQYMVQGDDWFIYVPCELAYGSKKDNSSIPAYSTLLFRVNMAAVYPTGSGVPSWK